MQEGSAVAAGAEAMEVGEAWAAAPDSCAVGPTVAVWAGERVGRAGILYGIDDGVGVVGLDATADLPSDIVIINLEDMFNLDALGAPAAAVAAAERAAVEQAAAERAAEERRRRWQQWRQEQQQEHQQWEQQFEQERDDFQRRLQRTRLGRWAGGWGRVRWGRVRAGAQEQGAEAGRRARSSTAAAAVAFSNRSSPSSGLQFFLSFNPALQAISLSNPALQATHFAGHNWRHVVLLFSSNWLILCMIQYCE
jgi:hypothetical protein